MSQAPLAPPPDSGTPQHALLCAAMATVAALPGRMGQTSGLARTAGGLRQHARHAGDSRQFREHKAYVVGDDVRHLDWRAYGRRGRATLKTFDDERAAHFFFVLQSGPSMRFVAGGHDKWRQSAVFVLALAMHALRQGGAVGLMGLSEPLVLASRRGGGQLQRVLAALLRLQATGPTPLSAIQRAQAAHALVRGRLARLPPHTVLVCVGDFAAEGAGAADATPAAGPQALGALLQARGRARRALVVDALHPWERAFPFADARHFVADAAQTSHGVFTDAKAAAPAYTQALWQRDQALKAACRQAQATPRALAYDAPLADTLAWAVDAI